MMPVEVGESSLRRSEFKLEDNPGAIYTNLNLVEEAREQGGWARPKSEEKKGSLGSIGKDHLRSKKRSAIGLIGSRWDTYCKCGTPPT
ncbi:hypothetical protein CR513_62870, partial [Mucuna pruriens]